MFNSHFTAPICAARDPAHVSFHKVGISSSEFGHLQIQPLGGSGLAALPAARGERTFEVAPHPPQR